MAEACPYCHTCPMTNDEWELADLPRQLAYEATRFGSRLESPAGRRYAFLMQRYSELSYRIRYNRVMGRWYTRKLDRLPACKRSDDALVPMGIDEVIEVRRIVDRG